MDAGPGFNSYWWNNNSTNQQMAVTTSGVYSVLVTDSNGCQNFDAVNVTFVTCLVDIISQTLNSPSSIIIYPNPTSEKLNIVFYSEIKSNFKLKVYDLIGKIVFSDIFLQADKKEIDLGKLAKGMYLMSLENETGEVWNLRVVVE